MPFSSENLRRELDQRRIIDWAPELKNGKEAYAYLMAAVGTRELNIKQTRNGLHALYKIRGHGSNSEVLGKFLELSTHPRLGVRSEAVQLAVGIVRLSSWCDREPIVLSESQEAMLRSAVELGLTKRVAQLAQWYLDRPPSQMLSQHISENEREVLIQFFSAYFHEDWTVESDDPDEVVRSYVRREGNAYAAEVAEALKRLLAPARSDQQLEAMMSNSFGSYYLPSLLGESARTWLSRIRTILSGPSRDGANS